ncbi:MAG: hypothetical protein JXR83_08975 [Deltaproteobacteria bacterium]|nr:hypothetical protein [Deltaproteobacteria bacterium]
MPREFDPKSLLDDETGRWSFEETSVYQVFATLVDGRLTGVVTTRPDADAGRLFLREGEPVGVQLAEVYAPIGQLLLELGYIDAATFVKAQALIAHEQRLPGQVFIELNAIDANCLQQVINVQAKRQVRRFIEDCRGTFTFSRGPAFLTGFSTTTIGPDLLIWLSLERSFTEEPAERYLASLAGKHVKLAAGLSGLVTELGFGPPEERFLARLGEWHSVDELDKFGTLPRPQIGLLLKFLDMRQRLQLRPAPEAIAAIAGVPVTSIAPGRGQGGTAVAKARPAGKAKREKTERVSISVAGWTEPVPAREERTELTELPSIVVDYDALGVDAASSKQEGKKKGK